MNDDERRIEPMTAVITVACLIAGIVLITQGHEAWGGVVLSFALGGATIKPLVRPDN